jgi:hypothetical protein
MSDRPGVGWWTPYRSRVINAEDRQRQRLAELTSLVRRPGYRVVATHVAGRRIFRVEPSGQRINLPEIVQLESRGVLREQDAGLFPDCPQSWAAI